MIYKTIKGLADYMAKIAEQDILFHRYNKTIWRESEFSDNELNHIKERRHAIIDILKSANNTKNDELLNKLKTVMPETFIGFRMQDEIRLTCSHNGIEIL